MMGLQSDQAGRLSPLDAVLLGLVQGPTELLPISSSAHLTLLPWLIGRDYRDLDPELRKSVEVALHAGTAIALLIGQRRLVAAELSGLDSQRLGFLILSFAPAACVGLALERPIERRLGGPGATALGLVAGSLAMALADRRPVRPRRPAPGPGGVDPAGGRANAAAGRHSDADWRDGLALGLAQAAALAPGVSRNGATLTAARLRGFSRADANRLSRVVALPVIAGASLLKGVRLLRRGIDARQASALAAGVAAAIGSTLASQRLIQRFEHGRALWPYAAYRLLLAALILGRRRRSLKRRGVQDS